MNNNSFDTLIKLHKVEKRLLEINHSRGDLPGKIDVIKNKIYNKANRLSVIFKICDNFKNLLIK